MKVQHITIHRTKPRRIRAPAVCLACGQTMERSGSLKKHYFRIHRELLDLKSPENFSFDFVKSQLEKLKKEGKWTEPTQTIPVKRTKKYRYLDKKIESSDEDIEEYYKNYKGPYAIQVINHSSSDEYEEVFENFQCSICNINFASRNSLSNHKKRHEKKGDKPSDKIKEEKLENDEENLHMKEESDDEDRWSENS